MCPHVLSRRKRNQKLSSWKRNKESESNNCALWKLTISCYTKEIHLLIPDRAPLCNNLRQMEPSLGRGLWSLFLTLFEARRDLSCSEAQIKVIALWGQHFLSWRKVVRESVITHWFSSADANVWMAEEQRQRSLGAMWATGWIRWVMLFGLPDHRQWWLPG